VIFGIDYDGTFARDPEFWEAFVPMAKIFGHECVLVTGRSDSREFGDQVTRAVGALMPIVFAGSNWKREAALKKGWRVDVWIDDNPEYVAEQSPIMRAALGREK